MGIRILKVRTNKDLVFRFFFIAVIILISSIFSTHFRSQANLINILNQIPPLAFVAIGQTLVILTTGIDLSVGAIMSMSTIISASMMEYGDMLSVFYSVFLIIFISLFFGFINGLFIAKLKMEPLIVTLATSTILNGINLFILPYPGGYCPSNFTNLFSYKIFDIMPLSFLYFLVIFLVFYMLLHYTSFGRHIYAVGGNERKAGLAGIKTDKIKIGVYMLSSLCASLSGLVLAARMHSGDPTAGEDFTLMSIAAVLIGGTTFNGGEGGINQTLTGIIIMTLLTNILNLFGVSPFYQNILTGLIVLVAAIYSAFNQ